MTDDRDRVDELLDAALEARGRAEPRPGLERRVLATLRSRPAPRRWTAFFGMSRARLAPAAAVVAIVAAVLVLARPELGPVNSTPPLAAAGPSAPLATRPVPRPGTRNAAPRDTHAPLAATLPAAAQFTPGRRAIAAAPRRTSFPAVSPPSEEERLLLRFVAHAPREDVGLRAGFLDEPASLPPLPDPTTTP